MTTRLIVLALGSFASIALAKAGDAAASQAGATGKAVETVARFHQSLARGDSAGAVQLLAPDAVILESGDRETRARYVAQHLGEDMKFAIAVPGTRAVVDSRRQGDVVWVISTSSAKGQFGDRQINSQGAELMVLSRFGTRWLIRAIHWSSHRVAE